MEKAKENKVGAAELFDASCMLLGKLDVCAWKCTLHCHASCHVLQVWMRSNQTAVSTAVDVRKPRFPWKGRPASSRPDLSSQMGQLLKTEEQQKELTVEVILRLCDCPLYTCARVTAVSPGGHRLLQEKIEEKKAEFTAKLNTYMKRGVK